MKPAILGGEPEFLTPIPFASPTLLPFESLVDGFRDIIESGMVTKGKYLREYERALREEFQTPFALGVVNCTLGLYMLIRALELTGEVIVPSFSFMATFHTVEMANLRPIFVDCERDTFTIDPQQVELAINPNTSAIIGVNIFGNPPDIEKLEQIAKKHNLKLIFDSAHSFGTLYKGKPMGNHGDGEVFSSSATKLIATGEGGVITTRHAHIAEFLEKFREYGNDGNYDCDMPGINGRLSEFHAFLGLKLLPHIEEFAIARNRIANLYKKLLEETPGIVFQKIREGCRSSYKDIALIINEEEFGMNRDLLAKCLTAEGIETRKYFYPPGHRQKAYRKYFDAYSNGLVNTDYIANNSIILPLYSHMDDEKAEKVANAIVKIQKFSREIVRALDNSQ